MDSANPLDAPRLQLNLLQHPEDVTTMVKGIKQSREILAANAFNTYRKAELSPGPEIRRDEAIAAWLRHRCNHGYHAVGTCKMGNDELAVVDDELPVQGLDGLRVVDASIMPTLVSGNTNAPTIMIGEKGADLILNSGSGRIRVPSSTDATKPVQDPDTRGLSEVA